MGVRGRLAALAVFATAGCGSGFFAGGAGATCLFGGAAYIGKSEAEETEAEEDGFHGS